MIKGQGVLNYCSQGVDNPSNRIILHFYVVFIWAFNKVSLQTPPPRKQTKQNKILQSHFAHPVFLFYHTVPPPFVPVEGRDNNIDYIIYNNIILIIYACYRVTLAFDT